MLVTVSQLRQASSPPDDVESVMDAEDLLALYQHLLASVPGASASAVASEFAIESVRDWRHPRARACMCVV